MIVALPEHTPVTIRASLHELGIRVSQQAKVKVSEFVPVGGRDSALVAIAGLLASAVTRGERTLLEAIHQIRVWAKNFTETVAGDSVSPEKAQQKLIEFLIKDVTVNRRGLPPGWDDGLDNEQKRSLGVSELQETLSDPRYDLNDAGNAERFADKYRDRVRYEVDTKIWRIWSGRHWNADDTREIERMAQEVVHEIDREADLIVNADIKGKVRVWAKRSGDRARLVSMVNLAGSDSTIACRSTGFDNVPGLLPVLNGVVDLTTGDVLPHSPDRLIAKSNSSTGRARRRRDSSRFSTAFSRT